MCPTLCLCELPELEDLLETGHCGEHRLRVHHRQHIAEHWHGAAADREVDGLGAAVNQQYVQRADNLKQSVSAW